MWDKRQIAVFVPLLAVGLGAIALAGRPASERGREPAPHRGDAPLQDPGPAEVVAVVEPVGQSAAREDLSGADANWWRGKEALRRRLERAKYFPSDTAAESAGASSFETEEEAAEAVATFVFVEFRSWAKQYRRETNPRARRRLLEEGIVRATIRHPHMARLMHSDPRKALKVSLPLGDYAALPPEVRALVEKPFSTLVTIRPGNPSTDGEEEYAARFRGEEQWIPCALLDRRSRSGALVDCPAQGIRLGDFAVLRDEVIQVLGNEDCAGARLLFAATVANPDGDRCFASGNPLGPLRATGLAAGSLFVFENERTLWQFNRRIGSLDTMPGEVAGSRALLAPRVAEGASAGFDFDFAAE